MSAFSFIDSDAHELAGAEEQAQNRGLGTTVDGAVAQAGVADVVSVGAIQNAGPLDAGMFALDSSGPDHVAVSGGDLLTGSASPSLLEQLESTFANPNSPESTKTAETDSRIVEMDDAVSALTEKAAALELQKIAAANAKDFRTASRLSKELQSAKEEQAAKQMELDMLKAARSSQTLETWVTPPQSPTTRPDDESGTVVAGAQAPTLAPGWQRLQSKDYPGRFYYYHETSNVSQWDRPSEEAPPPDVMNDEADDTSKACLLKAAQADLVRERELREAAEGRVRAAEQEIGALESSLRDEVSAAAELRTAHHAAEIAAEQEKASAVAAAHKAGVMEGREQMEEHMQELQERVQAHTAAVGAAQIELSGLKADLADATDKRQAAEATTKQLRLKLKATDTTLLLDEYTESESESESEVESEGSELTKERVKAAEEHAENKHDEIQQRLEASAVSPRRDSSPRAVNATFTEPGSLGLKLSPYTSTTQVQVQLIGINRGTQAEQHPEICPGMILASVAGLSVTGKPYKEVLGIIKQSTRPVTLSFVPHDADSGMITAIFTRPGALGMRFGKGHGNSVELVHINPGSQATDHPQVQPGLVVHSVRGAPCTGKTFQEVLQHIKLPERPVLMVFKAPSQASYPDINATFTKPGSLGLSFTHNKETDTVEVLQVDPGSQAVAHPQLVPGLTLHSIGGMPVAGTKYADVIGMLRASSRPVSMTFRCSSTAVPSPGSVQPVEQALATGSNDDMRVVIPRGDWRTTAAAKAIKTTQQADEEEVAGLPQAADKPPRSYAHPAMPTWDPLEEQKSIEAKVEEARALATSEAAEAADARVSKVREEGAGQLRQLQAEQAATVQRYQEIVTAEQAGHQATMKQLVAAKRERDDAIAKCDQDQREKEAHFETEVQTLLGELEEKDKLHAMHLAAAARLEDRWRDCIREAQRMRHERGSRACLMGSDKQQNDEDEEIFVCYLCQKGVVSL